jgi:hypothetical protein
VQQQDSKVRVQLPGFPEWILLLGVLGVSLASGEVLLRALLHSNLFPQLSSNLIQFIAEPYTDDSYRFKLLLRFEDAENSPNLATFDSVLGWTAEPRTGLNPLGIVTDKPYSMADLRQRRVLLFFGDSFVEGFTAFDRKIPQLLDERFQNLRVLNFGVGGYGLDQMYLQMESVVDSFEHPHLVFGVLFDDIDRVTFEVRDAPKPYFSHAGSGLVLRNVPLSRDHRDWLDRYPPKERVYVLCAVRGVMNRLLNTRWGLEYFFDLNPAERTKARSAKQEIVTGLVRAIKAKAAERNLPLTFVLFPHPHHLIHDGWRERFLSDLLTKEGINFLYLKDALLEHIQDNNLLWWKDVYQLRAHPTGAENAIMAQQIANFLETKYGY